MNISIRRENLQQDFHLPAVEDENKAELPLVEIRGILKVMDAMIDEGPVSGISNLDDPEAFLKKVIQKAESGYELSDKDKGILENLREWKADKE